VSTDDVLRSYVPRRVAERLDRILRVLATETRDPGETVEMDSREHRRFFASGPQEWRFYVDALQERGDVAVEWVGSGLAQIGLTPQGWNRIAAMEAAAPETRQGFVAMSFDPSMDEAWKNGHRLAIRDAGFEPLRVDFREHNEKICDVIVIEIRKSHFVVADVTMQRPGVYFEAGYAMGRGLPVIWCCQASDLAHCHFDTRQYSHVVWSTPEDLRQKLTHRIQATIH